MDLGKPLQTARRTSMALAGLAFMAIGAAFGGCLIDERPLDTSLADCQTYCTEVMSKCVGDSLLYTSMNQCLQVCEKIPAGAAGEEPGLNTLRCRLDRLNRGAIEDQDCAFLGPLGGGECGSDCDAYCGLRKEVCGGVDATNRELQDAAFCERACPVFQARKVDGDLLSGSVLMRTNADTLQCRTGYLLDVLAQTDPTEALDSCHNSQIVAENQLGPCRDEVDQKKDEDCDVYCNLIGTACGGTYAVYESPEQCQAVCAGMFVGGSSDTGGDSLRCRRYHSYNALLDQAGHCPHAGPTGDGVCVDSPDPVGTCSSYCGLLKRACGTAFAARYTNDDALGACVEDCEASLPPAPSGGVSVPRYSVQSATESAGLACRTLLAVRALEAGADSPGCADAMSTDAMACTGLSPQ